MFDQLLDGDLLSDSDSLLAATAQLEANSADELKRQRKHARFTHKTKVTLQPGNASERHKVKVQGVSGDISGGGCQVLFPTPMQVGDIYWLTLECDELNVDPLFARCMRCRMIREDAFETGFSFFSNIQLPAQVSTVDNDLL